MRKLFISILSIGIIGFGFFIISCSKKKDDPAPATNSSTNASPGTTSSGATTNGTSTSGTTTSGTTSSGTTTSGNSTITVNSPTSAWASNAIIGTSAEGSTEIWFKAKPTTSGTYKITSVMTAIQGNVALDEVGIIYLPSAGSVQYWSTATTGGTVDVTVSGSTITVSFSEKSLFDYTNASDFKVVTSSLSVQNSAVNTQKEKGSFTYTLNDNGNLLTADSVHWDLYNNTTYRIQAFVGSVAVLTLWPSSVATHTQDLGKQYVYWYDGSTIFSPGTGSLNLTNQADVLSGSIVANGNAYSPAGSGVSSIKANFKNVSKVAVK